jgi:hypothetical protein
MQQKSYGNHLGPNMKRFGAQTTQADMKRHIAVLTVMYAILQG